MNQCFSIFILPILCRAFEFSCRILIIGQYLKAIRPISAPEQVTGNLFHWIYVDVDESDTESVGTSDSHTHPANMEKSAQCLWETVIEILKQSFKASFKRYTLA